ETRVGATLFETERNDEAANHQEKDDTDSANVHVNLSPLQVTGETGCEAVMRQDQESGQATGDVEKSESLPGRGNHRHEGALLAIRCSNPPLLKFGGITKPGKRIKAGRRPLAAKQAWAC